MKILFLSRWFPWPSNNGSRIRAANLLACLAEKHTIDLVSFAVSGSKTDLEKANEVCRNVEVIPYYSFQPRGKMAIVGIFSRWPRSISSTKNPNMSQVIHKTTQQGVYEAVVAFEIDMALYALEIPRSRVKNRILEELELTTLYEQHFQVKNPIRKIRHLLMWQKWKNYINYVLGNFDGFTTVSDSELNRITHILKGKASRTKHKVVPNGIDISYYQGDFGTPIENTLIYSGALSYGANFDAVKFFLSDIWPLILKKRPETTFSITGKINEALKNQLPNSLNVKFTGYLPDIRPKIAQSWINIVPLRIGGGTRLKILESLALGTPVITTGKGVEGLRLIPDQDLLIADKPEEFAQKVLGLLNDPDHRQQLSDRGRQSILQYDWANNGNVLNEFIENLSTS